eukprot:20297_1
MAIFKTNIIVNASMYILNITVLGFLIGIELRTCYYTFFAPPVASNTETSVASRSDDSTASNVSTKSKSSIKLLFIMPLLCYFCYLTTGIGSLLSVFAIESCNTASSIATNSYLTGKCLMYFVFILRLHTVYSHSTFSYNTKILIILFAITVVYWISILIINVLTIEFDVLYDVNGRKMCTAYTDPTWMMVASAYDIIVSILCCVLFIRPLLILNKHEEHETSMLFQLVLKYVILTAIAVITTFIIFVFIFLLKYPTLITIDIVINCICIFFFNKRYIKYYEVMCCGAIKCLQGLCNALSKNNHTIVSSDTEII